MFDHASVRAVLGPTNTGKTHLAMERLAAHPTGVIGFPLRLLARENYDRLCRKVGSRHVALITGEERIVPERARYKVCTVESMPSETDADFLAVDEIQLCADPARGHIFTHRLLHARGRRETMFLGAETIRPVLRSLVPEAELVTRERLSRLSYAGARKLSRLPPRTAIVAFSAADVYQIAELLRRQRGGAAVVLGALSPRTRNAQVDLFQAGEVDFLVATDAIGMGLNMDIDHVAFARLAKYDGFNRRPLAPAEMAQIAGRAGRAASDGTFGVTDGAGEIGGEDVAAIETHAFDPLEFVQWRNAELNFDDGPKGLLRSLGRAPSSPRLRRAPDSDDQVALATLARDEGVVSRAGTPDRLRLLWDVCRVPDFRKIMADAHARLLAQLFRQLVDGDGRLDGAWVDKHISHIDRSDGDIDTLVGRIAHIRTWTYISYRPDWLPRRGDWQARTRAVEDRLSDALHERLTQRFVDRRSAVLAKSLKGERSLIASVAGDGRVLVEGEYVGCIEGLRFVPDSPPCSDSTHHSDDARALLRVARRALGREVARRVTAIEQAPDGDFALNPDGLLLWQGANLARLAPGRSLLRPNVRVIEGDGFLDGALKDRVAERLTRFTAIEIDAGLMPLARLKDRLKDQRLPPAARGLAFRLAEAGGVLPRTQAGDSLAHFSGRDHGALRSCGVTVGRHHVFLRTLLKPRARRLLGLLHSVRLGLPELPPLPPGDRTVVAVGPHHDRALLAAVGFALAGDWAVRLDRLEALAEHLIDAARTRAIAPTPDIAQMVGAPAAAAEPLLELLGYRPRKDTDGNRIYRVPRPRRSDPRPPLGEGPFAALASLREPPGR